MPIEPGSGEARRFAAAIHALLDDPARRARMGDAGRALIESRYDLETARRNYRALFTNAEPGRTEPSNIVSSSAPGL